jgi:PAS domain S-box-containing protein
VIDDFEDVPVGLVTTEADGTIVAVNRTFEAWSGYGRDELVGRRRFSELLTAGGRIYHETHYAPLLRMQGQVREIALEIVRADGSRLPALVNSVMREDRRIRTTVFDASDRRRYEEELLRARRREQDIAQQLQRSLLAGELPAAPQLDVAVVYRPGVRGLEVGGDWYDAFWLDEGRTVGLCIGDVVGRGIEAAATMGQLRSAMRALASTGLEPGPLLVALDAYCGRHAVGRMTTTVYAQLELETRRLRYACAGHPPPVICNGSAAFAWGGRSLPLDAHLSRAHARDHAEVELARGAAVVLYTDGLVERRRRPLPDGMDALLEAAAAAGGLDAEALGETLLRRLAAGEREDDICLLVARCTG